MQHIFKENLTKIGKKSPHFCGLLKFYSITTVENPAHTVYFQMKLLELQYSSQLAYSPFEIV